MPPGPPGSGRQFEEMPCYKVNNNELRYHGRYGRQEYENVIGGKLYRRLIINDGLHKRAISVLGEHSVRIDPPTADCPTGSVPSLIRQNAGPSGRRRSSRSTRRRSTRRRSTRRRSTRRRSSSRRNRNV